MTLDQIDRNLCSVTVLHFVGRLAGWRTGSAWRLADWANGWRPGVWVLSGSKARSSKKKKETRNLDNKESGLCWGLFVGDVLKASWVPREKRSDLVK